MSGPSFGIGRITIPYTASGLVHVTRMYVANPTLSGATWVIDARPSVGGTVVWSTAAEDLAEALSNILATGVTPGTAVLEEYSVTGWLPRDTVAVAFPNLSGNVNPAAQLTMTLRDDNFTRPKIVVMEHNQTAPFKTTSPTGGAGGADAFVAEFLPTGGLGSRPWVVMTNQHGHFLQGSPFISFTTTFNRKLRRARGLA